MKLRPQDGESPAERAEHLGGMFRILSLEFRMFDKTVPEHHHQSMRTNLPESARKFRELRRLGNNNLVKRA
jgi:hypothetical protein